MDRRYWRSERSHHPNIRGMPPVVKFWTTRGEWQKWRAMLVWMAKFISRWEAPFIKIRMRGSWMETVMAPPFEEFISRGKSVMTPVIKRKFSSFRVRREPITDPLRWKRMLLIIRTFFWGPLFVEIFSRGIW